MENTWIDLTNVVLSVSLNLKKRKIYDPRG